MKKTALLTAMVFASLLMQFCTNTCSGGDGFNSRPTFVNAYTYNRIMYLRSHVFSYAGKDSVQSGSGDTLCFQFHCDVRTAEIGKQNSAANLMACEPAPVPLPTPIGDSLNIISLDVFNAQYPAGSDISVLFRFYNPFSHKFSPLDEFSRFNTEMNLLHLALTLAPDSGLKRFRLSVHSGDKAAAKIFDTQAILFY